MSDAMRHEECVELLSAYLDETLDAATAAAVATHLEQCADCNGDLQLTLSLHNHFARHTQPLDALRDPVRQQANFERLWARVQARPQPPSTWQRYWPVAVAAALVVAVAVPQYVELTAPSYRTLASAPARTACGQLRAQFVDQLTQGELQQLLGSVGAHIVDGPSERGVYTLRAEQPDNALRQLRRHAGVLLAEPTDC